MGFNETYMLFNYSIPSNLSQNLTINIFFYQNTNCQPLPTSSFFDQIFPIITLIIGALLTFLLDLFLVKLKENEQLQRYEYVLIEDILDILKEADKRDLMVKYYSELKKDVRFIKIKHYEIIRDFIQSIIQGESPNPNNLTNIRREITKKR